MSESFELRWAQKQYEKALAVYEALDKAHKYRDLLPVTFALDLERVYTRAAMMLDKAELDLEKELERMEQ